MPTGSRLTFASLSAVYSERVTIQQEEGDVVCREVGGFKGTVWDWEKKLICLECFLSFLIWLSLSFKSWWLDGIRHKASSALCFILLCFSFRNGANLRPKFNLEKYVCLWFWIGGGGWVETENKNKNVNIRLSIKKQINIREKSFSFQHPGPLGGTEWRWWWLCKLWWICSDSRQQQTPVSWRNCRIFSSQKLSDF